MQPMQHKQGESPLSKDVTVINEQIAKLKEKRKKALDDRYREVGKFLIKEYNLKNMTTDEIKEIIKERML